MATTVKALHMAGEPIATCAPVITRLLVLNHWPEWFFARTAGAPQLLRVDGQGARAVTSVVELDAPLTETCDVALDFMGPSLIVLRTGERDGATTGAGWQLTRHDLEDPALAVPLRGEAATPRDGDQHLALSLLHVPDVGGALLLMRAPREPRGWQLFGAGSTTTFGPREDPVATVCLTALHCKLDIHAVRPTDEVKCDFEVNVAARTDARHEFLGALTDRWCKTNALVFRVVPTQGNAAAEVVCVDVGCVDADGNYPESSPELFMVGVESDMSLLQRQFLLAGSNSRFVISYPSAKTLQRFGAVPHAGVLNVHDLNLAGCPVVGTWSPPPGSAISAACWNPPGRVKVAYADRTAVTRGDDAPCEVTIVDLWVTHADLYDAGERQCIPPLVRGVLRTMASLRFRRVGGDDGVTAGLWASLDDDLFRYVSQAVWDDFLRDKIIIA